MYKEKSSPNGPSQHAWVNIVLFSMFVQSLCCCRVRIHSARGRMHIPKEQRTSQTEASLVPHIMERETGIEPVTFSLARRCSTAEPLPHYRIAKHENTFTRISNTVGGERLELS